MKLDKQIFSKDAFKDAVSEDFVVVVLDFPKKTKLPEAQAAANNKVKAKFKPKGFPTVLLLTAEGEVFKTMTGFGGSDVKTYLKTLDTALKAQSFQ